MRAAVCLALLLVLAGCGGAPSPPPADPVDRDLVAGWRLARFAFERGQYDQAADLYEQVLERAYARDDLRAIGDVGYELAVVDLRRGEPAAAAARAERIQDELTRRGAVPFAELYLVEGIARYDEGDRDAALASANEALAAASSPDDPVVAPALHLKGTVLADRGQASELAAIVAALGEPRVDALRANRLELVGRLDLLEQRPEAALPAFRESADLRRAGEDYRAMAQALALGAQAAEALDRDGEAADLYFRAGRSAEVEGQTEDARRWLAAAARLAGQTGQAAIEEQASARLERLASEDSALR